MTDEREWAVIAAKGLVGAIPLVGPLAAEVIGAIIPNQRLDRIERLLAALENRLVDIPPERVERRFRDPEFVDLLEDGMHQSVRALEAERIEQIAALLKNALADDEIRRLRDKRLLSLLGELNNAELILLSSYTTRNQQDLRFLETHEEILLGPRPTFDSDQEQLDRAAIHDDYRNHLTRLGLLRLRFKRPKRGELPEFDDRSGTIKASGLELTPLGRLLLRRIDILGEDEF